MSRTLSAILFFVSISVYGQNLLDTTKIRSEFKDTYFKAVKRAIRTGTVRANYWKSGDTLLVSKKGMLIQPEFTKDTITFFGYEVPRESEIIITSGPARNPKQQRYEFIGVRTVGDTTVFGWIRRYSLEYYVDFGESLRLSRSEFFDEFSYYLNVYQDSLKSKYKLDSLELQGVVSDLILKIESDNRQFKFNLPASKIVEPKFFHTNNDGLGYIEEKYIEQYGMKSDKIHCHLSFVINEQGKPGDVIFAPRTNETLEKRLTEIIGNMPNWKPGTQDDKPLVVRKHYEILINKD